MPGLPPMVAPSDELVDGPVTAPGATESVRTVLEQVLDERLRRSRAVDPVFARELAARLVALIARGGRRLRPAFTDCGWRAAGGSGDTTGVLRTGAALELLQACALVHDDVMDGSVRRRGGPALHVELARRHWAGGMHGSAEEFGTSAAVLAGDLALAWADDLLTETALGTPHGRRLLEEWRAMRTEMVAGQYLDLRAQAARSSGADEALAIATLKSAMYTVARPLALGALLAGADDHVLDALRAAGRCAGLAFQLRDDVLGAFGDPARTGKPADDDLRSGKLTYLLAVALRLADAADGLQAAAAPPPHPDPDPDPGSGHAVERMRAALRRTGARDLVEARIEELTDMGIAHFEATGAPPAVRREFAALVRHATGVAPRRAEEVA
ncbi:MULTISPECIES: polyprenyl synthetase family protein [Streptomyces]|uniref:Polyprenyl synthetase family protein n=1 Tax=Streptomyces edwardsiae TaxID=3075527 RepID=A0ABU2QB89_9ACTN|nr:MULTISPECIES: polyprenyl synthetase family protein [unclassified Streptomyces]MDT0401706.1 polyprenyl synthetase family protein [Streptomyces sp. DSM 41635]